MGSRWLCLALLLGLLCPLGSTDYAPPQDYTAVVVGSDIPLYPIEICPNGTGNVLQRGYDLSFGVSYISLGCCSIGQYGIPDNDLIGLIGCCPVGQQACINTLADVFVSCVDDIATCTFAGLSCSPGYGNCPTDMYLANATLVSYFACCPLYNATNASDFSDYCDVFDTPQYTVPNFGDTLYGSCSQAALNASTNCLWGDVYTFMNSTNVTIAEPSNFYCGQAGECVTIYQNGTQLNITFDFDNTTSYLVTQYQFNTVGCCAVGLTPCFNDQQLYGCANATRGEVCCGTSICPQGSQCCGGTGCCPNALECCFQSPFELDPALVNVTQLYCGATYQNISCALDMGATITLGGNFM